MTQLLVDMNILIFHPHKHALSMIGFCLSAQSNFNILQASTLQQAIDQLLCEAPIDLVITTESAESDKLYRFVLSTDVKLPLILVADTNVTQMMYPDLKVIGRIRLDEVSERLVPLVKEYFAKSTIVGEEIDYIRINTSILTRVVPLAGDIFIRLSKIKFVKLFRVGSHFTRSDLEKFLIKRKVEYLYIRRSDFGEFFDRFKVELADLSQYADGDPQLLDTVADVQELIADLASQIGLTPEVVNMAKANVNLAIKSIGRNPTLKHAVDSSLMIEKNFVASHSVMLAHISCSIAALMEWPSETTFHKLIMAALFHDINFKSAEHAHVETLDELNSARATLGELDYRYILNHPLECASFVRGIPEIPPDVDVIVLQHHERPDGSGFPVGLKSHQIAPLAAVMIVAHDILDSLTHNPAKFDLADFLNRMDEQYQSLAFRKVWRSLGRSLPAFVPSQADNPV